jgi:hypothetical protein
MMPLHEVYACLARIVLNCPPHRPAHPPALTSTFTHTHTHAHTHTHTRMYVVYIHVCMYAARMMRTHSCAHGRRARNCAARTRTDPRTGTHACGLQVGPSTRGGGSSVHVMLVLDASRDGFAEYVRRRRK